MLSPFQQVGRTRTGLAKTRVLARDQFGNLLGVHRGCSFTNMNMVDEGRCWSMALNTMTIIDRLWRRRPQS